MNPVNKILYDVGKNRVNDNSLPKWWSRHQQKIEDDILTHETERAGSPPWNIIKAKMRRKEAEDEQREESIDKINAMFRG